MDRFGSSRLLEFLHLRALVNQLEKENEELKKLNTENELMQLKKENEEIKKLKRKRKKIKKLMRGEILIMTSAKSRIFGSPGHISAVLDEAMQR